MRTEDNESKKESSATVSDHVSAGNQVPGADLTGQSLVSEQLEKPESEDNSLTGTYDLESQEMSDVIEYPSVSRDCHESLSTGSTAVDGEIYLPRVTAGFTNSAFNIVDAKHDILNATNTGNASFCNGSDASGSIATRSHESNYGLFIDTESHVKKLESLVDSFAKLADQRRFMLASAYANLTSASMNLTSVSFSNPQNVDNVRPSTSGIYSPLSGFQFSQNNASGLLLSERNIETLNCGNISGVFSGAVEQPLDLSTKRHISLGAEFTRREEKARDISLENNRNFIRKSNWLGTDTNSLFQRHFNEADDKNDVPLCSSSRSAFISRPRSPFPPNEREIFIASPQCNSRKARKSENGRDTKKRKKFLFMERNETNLNKQTVKSSQSFFAKLSQNSSVPALGTSVSVATRDIQRTNRRSSRSLNKISNSLEEPSTTSDTIEEASHKSIVSNQDLKALTTMECSCGGRFLSLYHMAIHIEQTGHVPKDLEPEYLDHLPKLVRGQDVWMSHGHENAEMILRCVQCNSSFRSLPDLTVHMLRTKHYINIVGSESETAAQVDSGWISKAPGNVRLSRKSQDSFDPSLRYPDSDILDTSNSGTSSGRGTKDIENRLNNSAEIGYSHNTLIQRDWSCRSSANTPGQKPLGENDKSKSHESPDSNKECVKRERPENQEGLHFDSMAEEAEVQPDCRPNSSIYTEHLNRPESWWPYTATKHKSSIYSTAGSLKELDSSATSCLIEGMKCATPVDNTMKSVYVNSGNLKVENSAEKVLVEVCDETVTRKATRINSPFRLNLNESSLSPTGSVRNAEISRERKCKRTREEVKKKIDDIKKTKRSCSPDVKLNARRNPSWCPTGRSTEGESSSLELCRKQVLSNMSRWNANSTPTKSSVIRENTTSPGEDMNTPKSHHLELVSPPPDTLTAMKNFVERSFASESFVRGHDLASRPSFVLHKYFDSDEASHGRLHRDAMGSPSRVSGSNGQTVRVSDYICFKEELASEISRKPNDNAETVLDDASINTSDPHGVQFVSLLKDRFQKQENNSFDSREHFPHQTSGSTRVNVDDHHLHESQDESLSRQVCLDQDLSDKDPSFSKRVDISSETEPMPHLLKPLPHSTSTNPDRRSPAIEAAEYDSMKSKNAQEQDEDHREKRHSSLSCSSNESVCKSPDRSLLVGESVASNTEDLDDPVGVRSADRKPLTKAIPYLLSARSFEQVC